MENFVEFSDRFPHPKSGKNRQIPFPQVFHISLTRLCGKIFSETASQNAKKVFRLHAVHFSPVIPRRAPARGGNPFSLSWSHIAHKGDADCRVASLLAMTEFLTAHRSFSPVIPRRGAAPTWESVLFFPVPHRTQSGCGLPRRFAPRNDRVFDCTPFIFPCHSEEGRSPDMGIRSLFPGPASHTKWMRIAASLRSSQ